MSTGGGGAPVGEGGRGTRPTGTPKSTPQGGMGSITFFNGPNILSHPGHFFSRPVKMQISSDPKKPPWPYEVVATFAPCSQQRPSWLGPSSPGGGWSPGKAQRTALSRLLLTFRRYASLRRVGGEGHGLRPEGVGHWCATARAPKPAVHELASEPGALMDVTPHRVPSLSQNGATSQVQQNCPFGSGSD